MVSKAVSSYFDKIKEIQWTFLREIRRLRVESRPDLADQLEKIANAAQASGSE